MQIKKKIWIMNHYATGMFSNRGGRHYWFAENLIKHGYEPTIFCANTKHGSGDMVAIHEGKYIRMIAGDTPFVFVKTINYRGNGLQRINNMLVFSWNLYKVAREYSMKYGKPDVVLASSVHPLTMVAGLKIARVFDVPCICEVRDLWPESLVEYGYLKRDSVIAKILYQSEKSIYKKADKIIFTMEGGKDYIIEKGWGGDNGGPIDLDKIYHINNGIDLEAFDYYKENYSFEDEDLENTNTFKVIYTGSVRYVNRVEMVLDVAKLLMNQNVKFLIWGGGDETEDLAKRAVEEKIENICFKGRVEKKYIPFITSKAQLNIVFGDSKPLYRFGGSMNKMFDYFASGKPTLSTFRIGYSLIEKYNTGIELDDSKAETIAEAILFFKNLDKSTYNMYGKNARKAAEDYNIKHLTSSLIDIINTL